MTLGIIVEIGISLLGGLVFLILLCWVGYHYLGWELAMNRLEKNIKEREGK